MRYFWNGVITLATTLVAGVILAFFQDDIVEFGRGEKVAVDVYTGPWMYFPIGLADEKKEYDLPSDNAFFVTRAARQNAPLARIVFTNVSAETVNNIRLDFREKLEFAKGILVSNGDLDSAVVFETPRFIDVPALKPGESSSVFVISAVDISAVMSVRPPIVTSSVGRADIKMRRYLTEHSYEDPWILKWLIPFLAVLGGLLLIILGIAAEAFETYWKRLLENEDLYLDERLRFDADRKKFTPDWKRIAALKSK